MKAYNVTFTMGYGDDKRSFSMAAFGKSIEHAQESVRSLLFVLTGGTTIDNVKANAVIFGVDGKGKSLNKLKKK